MDLAKKLATLPRTERTAFLNDLARTAMGVASKVVATSGFRSLPADLQSKIREDIEKFADFTADNDPYKERDFGSIHRAGEHVYWKIDYYNRTLDGGSEDPADPAKTRRVLTIMLAEEY